MPIDNICSDGPSIIVSNDGCGNACLCVDETIIARSEAVVNEMEGRIGSAKYEIRNEIESIKEEYENKLQRQKVHISGGGRVKGSRIHGRRCKIAIPKRSFRNQKGITGFPNGFK